MSLSSILGRFGLTPLSALIGCVVAGTVIGSVLFFFSSMSWYIFGSMGVALLLYLLVRFIFRWLKKRSEAKIQQGVTETGPMPATPDARGEIEETRGKLVEAITTLKEAKISIYEIPWIMLIGEPKSGKSVTLQGAELQFPAGDQRIPGLSGTKNCDWFFSNEAVILDTAGRFTFQDEQATDRAEWTAFLKGLKSWRRHCPVNGVIVIIPVDALMQDQDKRKEKASNIHSKLAELQTLLGVQFPVYVMVTKCDKILGFSEFFESFNRERSAQMLGWSTRRPIDDPDLFCEEDFDRAYEDMYRKLCDRRVQALRDQYMQQAHDEAAALVKRGYVFEFPENFKSLQSPLREYLGIMFPEDRFHESLFFRGFFFSSGMQQGKALMGVAQDILSGAPAQQAGDDEPATEGGELGKLFPSRPFFLPDFYKRKTLRENGLVFRSQRDIKRARRRWMTTTIGGSVAAVLLALMFGLGLATVHGKVQKPLEHANSAARAIGVPVADQPRQRTKVSSQQLLKELDTDVNQTLAPDFRFRLAFPFSDPGKARSALATIRDAMFLRTTFRHALKNSIAAPADAAAAPAGGAAASATGVDPREQAITEYLSWFVHNRPASPATAQDGTGDTGYDANFGLEGEALESLDRIRAEMNDPKEDHPRPRVLSRDPKAVLGAISRLANDMKTAGQKENKDWKKLADSGAALRSRYTKLLALADAFSDARTKPDYDEVKAKWMQAYAGDRKQNEPSFDAILKRFTDARDDLQIGEWSDIEARIGEIGTQRTKEIDATFEAWLNAIDTPPGNADTAESEMSAQLLATEQQQTLKDDITRIRDQVKSGLGTDLEADRKQFRDQLGLTQSARKRDEDAKADETSRPPSPLQYIATIDEDYLKPCNTLLSNDTWDPPPVDGKPQDLAKMGLVKWTLKAERATLAATEKSSSPSDVPSDIATQLDQLQNGVKNATARCKNYTQLTKFENWLKAYAASQVSSPATSELNGGSDGKLYTWKDLKDALDQTEAKQRILRDTYTGDHASTALMDERSPQVTDTNVASRCDKLLDKKLETYAKAYFDYWHSRYDRSNWQPRQDLLAQGDWDDYREYVINREDSILTLTREVADALIDNVFAIERELKLEAPQGFLAGNAKDPGVELRDQHLTMLKNALKASDIKPAEESEATTCKEGLQTMWSNYVSQIKPLETLPDVEHPEVDAWKSRGDTCDILEPADREMRALIDHGKWQASLALDQGLQAAIKGFNRGLPFRGTDPTDDDMTVNQIENLIYRDLKPFYGDSLVYIELTPGIDDGKRKTYLDGLRQWINLLFKKEGDAYEKRDINVVFEWMPFDAGATGHTAAETHFIEMSIQIGDNKSLKFTNTKGRSGESVWKFGSDRDITIELDGQPLLGEDGSPLSCENEPWSLPKLLMRGVANPTRNEWTISFVVHTAQGNPLYGNLKVTLKNGRHLPEKVAKFVPGTPKKSPVREPRPTQDH